MMKKWMLLLIIVATLAYPTIILESNHVKAADIEHNTINLNKLLLEKGYATLYDKTELIPPKFRTSPDTWPDKIPTSDVDAEGTCTHVVDGDTIDVQGVGRVRLAAINTPEEGEPGYQEAKDYVTQVCLNKKVYLDIDPERSLDQYNRILAMVYVSNETNKTQPLMNQTPTTLAIENNTTTPPTTKMPPTGTPITILALGILTILTGIVYSHMKK
ncbi:MAG: thermonuclease family protein [Methanothermobacter tenebrarum]|jgi:endonuclease YncB( thermonuclease family)